MMLNWINADEKTPSNSKNVLGWIAPYGIVKDGEVEPVHYDNDDWYDLAGRTCTVTHWMPLPEPPL